MCENTDAMNTVIECRCAACTQLCRNNPGWPTPTEAEDMITHGYGDRLMLDWLDPSSRLGNDDRIYVLAPASFGREGKNAPEMDEMMGGNSGSFMALFLGPPPIKGRCVLLTDDGRCEVHGTSMKPTQCRSALGCKRVVGFDNFEMAAHWNTDEGRRVVEAWKATHARIKHG
jgi:Fe-S-cluster containining protein